MSKKCVNCRSRSRLTHIKEPLCEECLERLPTVNCSFCSIDHHRLPLVDPEDPIKMLCYECRKQYDRYQCEPHPCLYCGQNCAFADDAICFRCKAFQRRFGDPTLCPKCGSQACFDRGDQFREHCGGEPICYLCYRKLRQERQAQKSKAKIRQARAEHAVKLARTSDCAQCRQLSAALDAVREKREKSKSIINELKTKLHNLSQQHHDELRSLRVEMEQRVIKATQEATALKAEVSLLSATRDEGAIAELKTTIREFTDTEARLRSDIMQLTEETTDLRRRLALAETGDQSSLVSAPAMSLDSEVSSIVSAKDMEVLPETTFDSDSEDDYKFL